MDKLLIGFNTVARSQRPAIGLIVVEANRMVWRRRKLEREVWLRPNRRALWLSTLPAALLAGIGFYTISRPHSLEKLIGCLALLLAAVLLVAISSSVGQPRLAYSNDQLLVFLRAGRPIRLPIQLVECFFLGQGPAMLAGGRESSGFRRQATRNIIARLAESAVQWREVEVQPRLGQWREGYITIRGTWCEPISPDLVGALNEKLAAAHRRLRTVQEQPDE